jgi:serine/threonine-protein kinase
MDPFIGRVLSHYRLEERLGAGGMGVLYRATDLKLGRAVAVKLLARHLVTDETAKARFVREARAASALDHSNIANVHEIGEEDGELFIVMALYDGETLARRLEKGRLPVDEAIGVLRQVGLGLEAAHRAGIVHRDIKPSNILRTSSGTLKILDFGVAKLLDESQAKMTQAGQPIGTVLYMSPEQLTGKQVDARSDLWSLGVLGYEALAGVSPFQTDSSAATTKRILDDDPPSLATVPGVPAWLAELMSQLLRKNPAERPQSASELLKQLDKPVPTPAIPNAFRSVPVRRSVLAALIAAIVALGAGGFYLYSHRVSPGKLRSLVVLPFVNVAANPDAEYLSDGIADGLINSLSQIPELRVIARTTAFRYKGKELDLEGLRRQLSVDSVLSGRVQQVGNTLVIQADLVDTGTGAQLWGEQYNRPLTEVLRIQEEITKAIADKLRKRFTVEVQQRVTRGPTANPAAYQLYLRGRYFAGSLYSPLYIWNKSPKEQFERAIDYFQQAINVDPNYALAYVAVADSYANLGLFQLAPQKESYARAEVAATKALALDDELAEGHTALALVKLLKWDWLSAEKELRRALALSSNYALAHNRYGLYLSATGHFDDALAEFKKAEQLDPANGAALANAGLNLCVTGTYDLGVRTFRDAIHLLPSYAFGHFLLAQGCYLPRKRYQEVVSETQEALALDETSPRFLALLAHVYAASGKKDDAWKILKGLIKRDGSGEPDVAVEIGHVFGALGDRDRAFEWLEKAYQGGSSSLIWLKVWPVWAPLRSDARYADLVRRMGFPP